MVAPNQLNQEFTVHVPDTEYLDDPHQIVRLAWIRFHHDTLRAHEVMVFADELDIYFLSKVGAAWLSRGTQAEIRTPGPNEKHYLAGGAPSGDWSVLYDLSPRKTMGYCEIS